MAFFIICCLFFVCLFFIFFKFLHSLFTLSCFIPVGISSDLLGIPTVPKMVSLFSLLHVLWLYYLQLTYNLFWRLWWSCLLENFSVCFFLFLFLCLFFPHLSSHYLRMYYNHSLGCKSAFDFCSVFLDLRNHTLCEWRSQIQTLLPVILRKCDILHVCVWRFMCTDYCYPSRLTAVLSDPWDGIFYSIEMVEGLTPIL